MLAAMLHGSPLLVNCLEMLAVDEVLKLDRHSEVRRPAHDGQIFRSHEG
jgi:hypothetical protein